MERNNGEIAGRVTFSGEESDRFVSFAMSMKEIGIIPEVAVTAFAPSTKKKIEFSGIVTETIWEKYRRKIIVQTENGKLFPIAGSNASSSFSADSVIFLNAPNELGVMLLSDSELTKVVTELPDQTEISLRKLIHNVSIVSNEIIDGIIKFVEKYYASFDVICHQLSADLLALIGTRKYIELAISLENLDFQKRFVLRLRKLVVGMQDYDIDYQSLILEWQCW